MSPPSPARRVLEGSCPGPRANVVRSPNRQTLLNRLRAVKGVMGLLPDLSIDRATTVQRVADALRSAMFAGDLRPGTPLREVELAEEMSVSRGSVREALLGLAEEGLLTRSSFRGVQVRKLTSDDVRDVFLTRRVIELSAVEAASNAPASELKALYVAADTFADAMRSGDSATQNETDLNVHRAIVGLLQSPRLTHIHSGLMAELRVALAAEYRGEDAVPQEELVDRHREFARMLRNNEIEAARAQLEERLKLAEERLVARMV